MTGFVWCGRVAFALCLATAALAALRLLGVMVGVASTDTWLRFAGAPAVVLVIAFLYDTPDVISDGSQYGFSFYLFWVGAASMVIGEFLAVSSAAKPRPNRTQPSDDRVDRPQRRKMIECPQCSILIADGAVSCSCGWQVSSSLRSGGGEVVEELKAEDLQVVDEGVQSGGTPASPPAKAKPRISPGCPQCRAPTKWVAEFEQFFCGRCNVYLE